MKLPTFAMSFRVFMVLSLALTGISTANNAFAEAQRELKKLMEIPDKPAAPDFSFPDMAGATHTLATYRGKVLVVNFWATWCAPCRTEMPSLQNFWEQTRDHGVVVLAISYGEGKEQAARFFETVTVDFPVLLGQDLDALNKAWSLRGLPTTFVVNPEGRLVYKVEGDIEWDTEAVIEKVLALTIR